MRVCKTCGAEKAPQDYYTGITAHCRDCWKARVRANREANIDRVRAYDRQRGQLPTRKDANARRYRELVATEEGRQRDRLRSLKWGTSHPEKRAAHITVDNAIRDGKLIPAPCERCGASLNVHAHHEDYSKPLDVMWLCRACHGQRHREINEERRKAG